MPGEKVAIGIAGEKVAKVKVGLYEAVRDGMVVNLLLEAIPDLHLRLDAIPDLHLRLDANRAWTPLKGQQFAKYAERPAVCHASSLPNTLTRIIATASRFSKSRAKPAMIRVRLPVKPALPLPGMKACASRILPL